VQQGSLHQSSKIATDPLRSLGPQRLTWTSTDIGVNDRHVAAATVWLDDAPEPAAGLFTKDGVLFQTIRVPGYAGTWALNINNDGDVVGAVDTEILPIGVQAGLGWLRRGVVDHFLEAPCGGQRTEVRDHTSIPVGARVTPHHPLAAVTCWHLTDTVRVQSYAYDPDTHEWVELAVPGAVWTEVRSVNADGEFGGWYVDADGGTHGFIARPSVELAQR
jgi:hypothetical protein